MSSKLIYYVYAYVRSKDSATAKAGTPYYIGKGKLNRAFAQHRTNGRGIMTPPPDRIVFLERNLSEIGALAVERRMIRWYGRINNNSGILHNMTDGGEGTSGIVTSLKTKLHQSMSRKGIPKTVDHKAKISLSEKGKQVSQYTRNLQSIAKSNMTQQHKEKLSNAASGTNNSQYGTRWIHKDDCVKKIAAEQLPQYVLNGWSLGRG